MSTTLPPELERFVESEVANGAYPTEDALIADAVRLLQERKRHALRLRIQQGIDDLDHGDAIELDDEEDLAAFFQAIEDEVHEELAVAVFEAD